MQYSPAAYQTMLTNPGEEQMSGQGSGSYRLPMQYSLAAYETMLTNPSEQDMSGQGSG